MSTTKKTPANKKETEFDQWYQRYLNMAGFHGDNIWSKSFFKKRLTSYIKKKITNWEDNTLATLYQQYVKVVTINNNNPERVYEPIYSFDEFRNHFKDANAKTQHLEDEFCMGSTQVLIARNQITHEEIKEWYMRYLSALHLSNTGAMVNLDHNSIIKTVDLETFTTFFLYYKGWTLQKEQEKKQNVEKAETVVNSMSSNYEKMHTAMAKELQRQEISDQESMDRIAEYKGFINFMTDAGMYPSAHMPNFKEFHKDKEGYILLAKQVEIKVTPKEGFAMNADQVLAQVRNFLRDSFGDCIHQFENADNPFEDIASTEVLGITSGDHFLVKIMNGLREYVKRSKETSVLVPDSAKQWPLKKVVADIALLAAYLENNRIVNLKQRSEEVQTHHDHTGE